MTNLWLVPGMNGFDVLRAIPSEQLPAVIFLTAHQEHALQAFEIHVDPARFARIHRSKIVRLDQIFELQTIENREHVLKLLDGSQHRSSRTYADRLERWLRPGKVV